MPGTSLREAVMELLGPELLRRLLGFFLVGPVAEAAMQSPPVSRVPLKSVEEHTQSPSHPEV